jgi:hypothetical protein
MNEKCDTKNEELKTHSSIVQPFKKFYGIATCLSQGSESSSHGKHF